MKYTYEGNNIFLKDDNIIIASISFEKIDDDTYNITKTHVDEKYRGKGIASKLVGLAKEEIEKRNCKVVASCSYAKDWLSKKV